MVSFEKIVRFALTAHEGQKDKQGEPYILHPLNVMMKMESEEERIVAILHDVVEDTEHTLDDLQAELGLPDELITAIDCVTRRHNEKYEDMIERVKTNKIATKVKIADLEHNMDLKRIKNRRNLKSADLKRMQKYITAWTKLSGD